MKKYPGSDDVMNPYYRDIFNREFNIGFEPADSDTCNFGGECL